LIDLKFAAFSADFSSLSRCGAVAACYKRLQTTRNQRLRLRLTRRKELVADMFKKLGRGLAVVVFVGGLALGGTIAGCSSSSSGGTGGAGGGTGGAGGGTGGSGTGGSGGVTDGGTGGSATGGSSGDAKADTTTTTDTSTTDLPVDLPTTTDTATTDTATDATPG
jgi:hypothetical protein